MSGGVDSAVSALLLKRQGYIIEAVFMKNWEEDHNPSSCPAARDFEDAQAVCDMLQIPLHAVNFAHEYWQRVFQFMLDEYVQGRTPNPDIMCNQEIKFKSFLNYAKQLNADFIATGHYARHVSVPEHKLYKAIDRNKDQTYFLCTLNQQQLASTLFPLGELTKDSVRAIAQKNKFPNYCKKDSTGICFIGERKFKKFLSEYLLAKPGEIVTPDGTIIGQHDGLMFYTLGQRQGLGIGGKKYAKEAPWYVVRKNIAQNKLIVAQDSLHPWLIAKSLCCCSIHWIQEQEPKFPLVCAAKIRYRQTEQACIVTKIKRDGDSSVNTATQYHYRVTFQEPQRAITAGQSVVFYGGKQGEECLGGGVISADTTRCQLTMPHHLDVPA